MKLRKVLWIVVLAYVGMTVRSQDGPVFAPDETIRVLAVGDPFAYAIVDSLAVLQDISGVRINIEVVSYNQVRELILLNSTDQISSYDIVSIDSVWMGEFADAHVLLPLDEFVRATPSLDLEDFLHIAIEASSHDDVLYGLPIQPHPELLWVNRDLLEGAGLTPPQTTEDVLAVAAALHNPEQGLYGICWNAQRGQALGQQMAHFYAAFGQPLLDEAGRPTLNTGRGIAAAEYALALVSYSPPDILLMAWDQRVERFDQGRCAMTYGWGARENLLHNLADEQTLLLPAPHAPGMPPVTPLGTWSLGIPANIGPRTQVAWHFLVWLSSEHIQRELVLHGNGGPSRISVLSDPELQALYPVFPRVLELERSQQLADWMRPAVPEWPGLADILGTVYHDMISGRLSSDEAAAEAQRQADLLFIEDGR